MIPISTSISYLSSAPSSHIRGYGGETERDVPGLTVPGHKCPQAAYMLFQVISVAFNAEYENVTGSITGS
jgi:hypothetical protein